MPDFRIARIKNPQRSPLRLHFLMRTLRKSFCVIWLVLQRIDGDNLKHVPGVMIAAVKGEEDYMKSDGINKRMVNLLILEILREETDSEHRITQQEIMRLLSSRYGIDCDRRTIRSNIDYLQDCGYDIDTEGGCCLVSREFDDTELRMLIDSVLFSKLISESQAKELIGKLEGLSSRYFRAKVANISSLSDLNHPDNKQILYSLDAIDDAIEGDRKIRLEMMHYDVDLVQHKTASGAHIVSPYRTVANNGKYYLICWDEKYTNVCYLRIDRMTDVVILEEKRKPLQSIPGYEDGLNLPQHMAEHVYMFSGEGVPIKLRIHRHYMDDLIDWFGKDLTILRQEDEWIVVRVKCNEQSMLYWALQYGRIAEVLEPQSLRNRIRNILDDMVQRYSQ